MAALLSQVALASLSNPSLAPTPPMGFNNWARFECALNETLFTTTADAMVSKGLLAAGYNRINLDDCWPLHERAPNGSLQWNATLFPNGIPWLVQYVEARGFKLGIYGDSGNETCGGYPGSQGYEQIDAETFESWGIDYLKLDGCSVYPDTGRTDEQQYEYLYSLWHSILSALPRQLVFSESAPAYFSPGEVDNNTDWYKVMDWVPLYGELARHSDDIAVYDSKDSHWDSVLTNYGYEVLLARYQQPGYFNDPDFIIADFPQLSLDEKRSQFALWASFSAPLIISAYVPDLTADEIAYLTNKDIVAVDQDALGLQATLVSQDGTWDVLTKNLANGDRLLTVLNRGNSSESTTISLERAGLQTDCEYQAKDLWTGKSSAVTGSVEVTLAAHATAIYRISGVSSVVPTGMFFNTFSLQCLTASADSPSLAFQNCSGVDGQVWTFSEQGQATPLSSPGQCVTAGTNGEVGLEQCGGANQAQQMWTYDITGNYKNGGMCLTDDADGSVGLLPCGDELDDQVFGLPSGVEVIRQSQ